MTSLAVVVPMYNEQSGASACVARLLEVLDRLPGSRLVAVDDGSADDTPRILDRLGEEHQLLQVVHREENGGYGAALRTGAETADRLGLDWVLFMDSDLTNPPEDVPRFGALMDGPVDYVKASRFLPGGRMVDVPLGRRILSLAANRFARVATGSAITDPTNGFRAVRASVFLAMPLNERGFAIIMEELYWAFRLGLRFGEVATTLRGRDEVRRPSSFSYRPSVLLSYARYTLRIAALRWFGPKRTGHGPSAAARDH